MTTWGRPGKRAALLTSLAAALLTSLAAASPADDLYRAATQAVVRDYYGWATADLDELSRQYGDVLAERCAPAGEACSFETGRTVLNELFTALGDAHTNVRDPEAALRLREIEDDLAVQRTGLRTVRAEGGLLVASVMPGSPAAQAGLRPLDLLTRVNGEAAGKRAGVNAAVGPNELIRLERGGQTLALTVQRAGTSRELTLGTALLQARDAPTLSWAGEDGRTAVISLPSFLAADSSELFLARLREAQAGGARQLVVDLRFNGGGSLVECVAAASIFAPVQYEMQFRGGSATYAGVNGEERRFSVGRPRPGDGLWKGPAAVLVGPNTASCAEVFTYYAQRWGALAVGERTRGVGNSGVTFQPLPDGGVVSVTVLRAFTADGQPLPGSIDPDVLAPTDIAVLTAEGRDTTLEAALAALAAQATR